ncbi:MULTISPECIES: Bax inhibitor-1/YccA family protein [Streptomyces]|uniref:YccA/Bax inhibitor family protein n=2 Tax=Streptomyces TaxID=1883 RepID=A0ABT9KM36_9ACTN|nr:MULTISPECIES: Bax inhibitor-1/YccA family protein [Streptomyces]MBW8089764.1 Bax inhibitor-1/YccA family protein [Streptomyces hygroscopicus subsp. hygroscopicus]MDN3057822.1 Bax inhibitor-1/YccA family protein [Streptomyces sp. SRF1]MDP9609508.1 putative YccA/Bax inhibitor family protein [Streptomyces demainii]GHJ27728.1 membrane protein [Streptomyces hygroscopicus]GLV79437.1 membrane protein [Streptomyces hygroscopicus subsp. hygroscopicus]
MRSSNPVFSRRGFSRSGGYAGFGAAPQAGSPVAGQGNPYAGGNPYAQTQPPTNPYAAGDQQNLTPEQLQQMYGAPPAGPLQTGRMTMDDVVMRTGMTLGTVIVAAAVAWIAQLPVGVGFGAALVAMVLGLVQSFKRTVSPALIIGYALFEGLFLGVISQVYNERWSGIPMQAVLGTMAVFVGVLVAYKTRLIRVNARFQRFVLAAAIGFLLLMTVNLLFAAFGGGDGLGFRSGGLGIVFGIVGVVLGAAFLAMDFKQVEDGVRYGAPREESWLAAFGLTLSLVWIYLELLRLISIFRE